MSTDLQELVPHLVFMFAGGVVASFGPGWWARREAVRERLGGTGAATVVVACVVTVAVAAVGIWALVVQLAEPLITAPATISPFAFLLFGLLVGLPLSLPGVLVARYDARKTKRPKRQTPATLDERREYARDIAEQIRSLSPERRTLEASLTGDEGRVLRLEGDLDGTEGDRLVAALRDDLEDLGFQRVEGRGPDGDWWARV